MQLLSPLPWLAPFLTAIAATWVLVAIFCHLERVNILSQEDWMRSLSRRTLAFLAALGVLVTGRLAFGLVAATLAAAIIGIASTRKLHYSGVKLAVVDLPNAFNGGGLFVLRRYPRLAAGAVAMTALTALVLVIAWNALPDIAIPRWIGCLATIVAGQQLLRRLSRWVKEDALRGFFFIEDRRHVSTFVATLFVAAGPARKVTITPLAEQAAALPPAQPARSSKRPHIIFIQHESTFDPTLYGIDLTDRLEAFLRPPGSLNGPLHVDVVGGSTWQTEFALMTGISSRCFGQNQTLVFHRLAGHIRRALPSMLAELGYAMNVLTTTPGNFANYETFYRSIGAAFVGGGGLVADPTFNNDDRILYDTGLAMLAASAPGGPQAMMLITDFNHSPHERPALPERMDESVREFARRQGLAEEVAEYLVRMDYCARCYAEFRRTLEQRHADETFLIVRYGDHQPNFVRRALRDRQPALPNALQRTFFAVEAIGFEPAMDGVPAEPLDVAFLGTLAMQAAGLPLDPITTLHGELMQLSGSRYGDGAPDSTAAFHRLLVDRGLLRIDR